MQMMMLAMTPHIQYIITCTHSCNVSHSSNYNQHNWSFFWHFFAYNLSVCHSFSHYTQTRKWLQVISSHCITSWV